MAKVQHRAGSLQFRLLFLVSNHESLYHLGFDAAEIAKTFVVGH